MMLADFVESEASPFAQVAAPQAPSGSPSGGTQSPPPQVILSAPQDQPAQLDDVVVLATRPDTITEIDRKVYTVSRDTFAQTMSALEILGRLPSVTVLPSGTVRLLGQGNVTILVDGQRPANSQALLRSLSGSGIDRIEVVTNPSAQFAAEGTGGVINIITRRPTIEGYSGTLVAAVDTFGGGQINYSPNLRFGHWTFAGSAALNREVSQSRGSLFREVAATNFIPAYDFTSLTSGGVHTIGGSLRLNYTYDKSPSERISGGFDYSGSESYRHNLTRFNSVSQPGDDRLQKTSEPIRFQGGTLTTGYSRRGPRDGELFTASLNLNSSSLRAENEITSVFAGPSPDQFRTFALGDNEGGTLKFEYKTPLSGSRLVTLGASWERQRERLRQGLAFMSGSNSGLAEFRSEVDGTRDVAAAYMTMQFPWAEFTLMPGLRLEVEDYEISGTGFGGEQQADLFPSFHLSRPLSDRLSFTLSYSERTSRPNASSLDPTLVYLSERQARRGNPQLLPQTTHAFEAGLDYTSPKHTISVKLYGRETSDIWAQSFDLDSAGLLVATRINAGDSWDRGLDVSLRGDLAEHFRYQASGNVYFSSRRLFDLGSFSNQETFTYTFNGRLEYIENPVHPARGNQLQLSLTYMGPQRLLQNEVDDYMRTNLTWRRPLTTRLAAVLVVQNLLDGRGARMRTSGDGFSEESRYEGEGVQARLSITYQFGG